MTISRGHWIAMGAAIAAVSLFWAYVAQAAPGLAWWAPLVVLIGLAACARFWTDLWRS